MRIAVLTAAVLCAVALPATAQVYPRLGQPGLTTGDIHRYETDRLRATADRNEALARNQALQSRLTIQQLQARRAAPLDPAVVSASRSPEEIRRETQAEAARAQDRAAAVGQIDAWLDRRPQ